MTGRGWRRRDMLAIGGAALMAPARTLAAQEVTARGFAEDVTVLRRAYGLLHPGLYRYNTHAEMEARFDRLQARLSAGGDRAEAFVALAELTAAVRCGHTYPNFYNQKKAVAAALFEGRDRLPFHFRWLGRRMLVIRNLSPEPALGRGTEIVSIDGRPAGAILDRLTPLSRADGHNQAKRIRNLEVRGEDEYAAFDIYYPMVFRPRDGRFRLQVRAPGDDHVRTIDVAAMSQEERRRFKPEGAESGPDQALWRLEPGSGKEPALLRMPTWVAYDTKWDWKADLDGAFDRLIGDGAPALIIDLRGNEGGSDVGDFILSRLIEREAPASAYHRWVRYRRTPADLDPFLDTWDPSFKDWKGAVAGQPDARGLLRMTRYDDDESGDRLRPRGRRYQGRVAVLVDSSNSSATFQFASSVKRLAVATLIGEPTGGNLRGINGGAFFFLRLPNCRIEVDLPLIGYFADTPQPDAGVQPDLFVRPTQADVAAGRDVEMDTARAWLSRS